MLQKQASWQVRLLWLTGEVPGIILLLLTAADLIVKWHKGEVIIKNLRER
ncbi:MAG: hypothetical protein U5O15_00610 [Candidatus Krumholzibacteriota bacterium]|nr:hypothetical protein [Candidatus Krumholzibacteriota bacterium]